MLGIDTFEAPGMTKSGRMRRETGENFSVVKMSGLMGSRGLSGMVAM